MARYLRPYMVLLCVLPTVATAQSSTPLTVEAALDLKVVAPLLTAFEQAHPDIALTYHDRSTLEVDQRAQSADPAPDVVISSAMPWQMARVNEGLAQPLNSDVARNWPAWAKWRNEVFGFTFEPIVTVYRLDAVPARRPLLDPFLGPGRRHGRRRREPGKQHPSHARRPYRWHLLVRLQSAGFLRPALGPQPSGTDCADSPLFSVLSEVIGPYTAQRLRDELGERLYPIPINASLLAFVDPLRRRLFMKR